MTDQVRDDRIHSNMDQLDSAAVRAVLTTQVFGREYVYLQRTGSTNDAAKRMASQGAPEGTIVVADEQTAGRGRLDRRWLAPPGTCLLCSILFRPRLLPTQTQRLTMLCSLAAADAIREVTGLEAWLKWPNDLIVPDLRPPSWSKLAGLLTQTGVVGEQISFVVVGIGINVNVQPDVLPTLAPNATSILAETGRRTDRAALLAALLAGVERRYEALKARQSPHRRAKWPPQGRSSPLTAARTRSRFSWPMRRSNRRSWR